jgi:hypothetical protein
MLHQAARELLPHRVRAPAHRPRPPAPCGASAPRFPGRSRSRSGRRKRATRRMRTGSSANASLTWRRIPRAGHARRRGDRPARHPRRAPSR